MRNQFIDGASLKRRAVTKENLFGWALVSPYVIIFVIFTLIPVLLGVVYSFMKYNPLQSENAEFIGGQNYADLFNFDLTFTQRFWDSFTPMLVFCIVAVPIMIIVPLALAYLINLKPPGHKIFRAILYFPSVLSISIAGIIFSCIFKGDSSGLMNAWLGLDIQWMAGEPFKNDILRWVVMLLLSVWWQTGTNFVIFSGALRNVPKSLYEACEMDGGSRWHTITRVTLPNIKSSINICLFTTLIGYMNLFGQPYVINALDNENIMVAPMQFIQYYLGNVSYAGITGLLCAAAIVFGLCVMTVSIIQQQVTKDKRRGIKWSRQYQKYVENTNYIANLKSKEEEVQNG